jgi:hypothetical protein
MKDLQGVRIKKVHRDNVDRYCRLLATHLTDLEREYIHRRLREEFLALERVSKESDKPMPEKDRSHQNGRCEDRIQRIYDGVSTSPSSQPIAS